MGTAATPASQSDGQIEMVSGVYSTVTLLARLRGWSTSAPL